MLDCSTQWPPDYRGILEWRVSQLEVIRSERKMLVGAREFYRKNFVAFVEDWCDTFDPRNSGKAGRRASVPFVLFPRQRELAEFLLACYAGDAHGLVEKSRDMGATWLCVCFSVWLFLFVPGSTVGWGSRKAGLVDTLGNMDSIFEKIRFLLRSLPPEFLPSGFGEDCMSAMKITSPDGVSSIVGEGGDDIGRGGRTRIYFKDESAHYEHPEAIEASLSDNTRVQIDISSVGPPANVFHRKRVAGVEWEPGAAVTRDRTNVFVLDWSDHPEKAREWHTQRENKFKSEGLLHVFRREVDRDYAASVENVIIQPEWVRNAVDAHLKIKGMDDGAWMAALDVADAGEDRNALALRKGVVLSFVDEWGERDTGVTARRAVDHVRKKTPLKVMYDCIGVGSGVKAETNRLRDENVMPKGMRFVAWDAGAGPLMPEENVEPNDPNTPLNKDFYGNLKAQGWWQLARRFEKTHRTLTEGVTFPVDELISIDSRCATPEKVMRLTQELSQPTRGQSGRLKLIVNKAPNGMKSPNMGDAVMMCFWPCEEQSTFNYAWVR